MDSFENLICDKNNDLDISTKINQSKYTENIDVNITSNNNYFNNIIYCIISANSMELDSSSTYIMFQQKIIDICNSITVDYLASCKFSKSIKPLKVQQSLQLSADNKNMTLALLFLREFYKTNFVIISNNTIYKDIVKNYDIQYIQCNNNKYRIIDDIDTSLYTIKNELYPKLEKNVKGNVYNTILKSITTYKLPELVKIAKEYNILETGKKKELYDRIYIELINK